MCKRSVVSFDFIQFKDHANSFGLNKDRTPTMSLACALSRALHSAPLSALIEGFISTLHCAPALCFAFIFTPLCI